jgi:hypothetical protein
VQPFEPNPTGKGVAVFGWLKASPASLIARSRQRFGAAQTPGPATSRARIGESRRQSACSTRVRYYISELDCSTPWPSGFRESETVLIPHMQYFSVRTLRGRHTEPRLTVWLRTADVTTSAVPQSWPHASLAGPTGVAETTKAVPSTIFTTARATTAAAGIASICIDLEVRLTDCGSPAAAVIHHFEIASRSSADGWCSRS